MVTFLKQDCDLDELLDEVPEEEAAPVLDALTFIASTRDVRLKRDVSCVAIASLTSETLQGIASCTRSTIVRRPEDWSSQVVGEVDHVHILRVEGNNVLMKIRRPIPGGQIDDGEGLVDVGGDDDILIISESEESEESEEEVQIEDLGQFNEAGDPEESPPLVKTTWCLSWAFEMKSYTQGCPDSLYLRANCSYLMLKQVLISFSFYLANLYT